MLGIKNNQCSNGFLPALSKVNQRPDFSDLERSQHPNHLCRLLTDDLGGLDSYTSSNCGPDVAYSFILR